MRGQFCQSLLVKAVLKIQQGSRTRDIDICPTALHTPVEACHIHSIERACGREILVVLPSLKKKTCLPLLICQVDIRVPSDG